MNRLNLHLYFSASFDNCHICNKSKKRLESTRECFIKCWRYQNHEAVNRNHRDEHNGYKMRKIQAKCTNPLSLCRVPEMNSACLSTVRAFP